MARYIDAEKIAEHKFVGVTHERYVSDGRPKSEEEIYAYKVGYNDAIESIAQFAPTADVVELEGSKAYKCLSYTTTGNPTADVRENVHAHWEGDGQCSNCKDYPLARYMRNPNFCPNCGAEMDERRTDNAET